MVLNLPNSAATLQQNTLPAVQPRINQGPQMPMAGQAPRTGYGPAVLPQNVIPHQNLLGAGTMVNMGQQAQPAPTTVAPQPMQPAAGLEQGALNGGGVSNKQQISNFMTALNNTQPQGNNYMNNVPPPPPPIQQPLVNPGIVPNPALTQSMQGRMMMPAQISSGPAPAQTNAIAPQQPQPQLQIGGPAQTIAQAVAPAAQPTQSIVPPMHTQQMLMSDADMKTNIAAGDKQVQQFLQSINAHNYQYKNPEIDGQGTFTSPMAQELESTELGKQAVIDTPRGKMVDYARLGGVNLAAVSVVHKEQEILKNQQTRLQSQFDQLRKQFKFNKDK